MLRGIEAMWNQSCRRRREDIRHEAQTRFTFISRRYLLMRALLWLPWVRTLHYRKFIRTRKDVAAIVHVHAPEIIQGLHDQQEGFNSWEKENRPSGNYERMEKASYLEQAGIRRVNEHAAQMLKEINQIPYLRWFFSGFRHPGTLIRNPYPGYLSSEIAVRYMEDLRSAFPS